MNDKQKIELRRLAEAATQGDWKLGSSESHGSNVSGKADIAWCGANSRYGSEGSYSISAKEAKANAKFIAAANPTAVLSLLDENAQLRAEAKELRKKAGKYATIERVMKMLECDEREGGIWTACTLLLIGSAHKMNSAKSVVDQEGVTVSAENLGNWRVTVERIDAAMSKKDSTK